MAYDDYEDDDPISTDELVASLRQSVHDLDERVRKLSSMMEDAVAGVRQDVSLNRREMNGVNASLSRLSSRFDQQTMALALANLASGVGVAALVLGAAHAIN